MARGDGRRGSKRLERLAAKDRSAYPLRERFLPPARAYSAAARAAEQPGFARSTKSRARLARAALARAADWRCGTRRSSAPAKFASCRSKPVSAGRVPSVQSGCAPAERRPCAFPLTRPPHADLPDSSGRGETRKGKRDSALSIRRRPLLRRQSAPEEPCARPLPVVRKCRFRLLSWRPRPAGREERAPL